MTSYAVFGSDRDDRDRARLKDEVRAMAQSAGSARHATFISRLLAAARRTIGV